ncbi:glycosyl hydrolase family 18 protein [Actinoplanes subtropicus]|uniref:glycosyl hydrolase family 18 protein n=1 Tax=Actinoplanes subtropicus TaxID=543632 RepID=UPI0004C3552B|nr:glycosyl hydrolase family 18 protein [Actinoplanes subtropicus]
MQKSLRRALWAGVFVVASTAMVPISQASAAAACAPAWSSTAVYVKDNVASQSGHNYTAKWWTQNESPATHSGQWDVWIDNGACGGGPTTPPTTPPTTTPTTPPTTPPTTSPTTGGPSGKNVVGYFAEWGVYARQYFVKNIVTSGSAAKMTHILYAFGNTSNGQCSIGDSYADYDMAYTTANSVDGVADTWDAGALRGNFNQLRKLKKMYPNIKVIWSFGGWTWSGGFTQAAANPAAFADSCYNLVKDSRWSDVFDGIDIDWEYPNACGLSCDSSGPAAYNNVISALRNRFGSSFIITSAISADGTNGGKLDVADYASGIQKLNLVFPMTYDYFGAFSPQGPTAPHSPLTSYAGIPTAGFYADAAIQKLKSKGVPANKILLGIGFYGRGWTGVTQSAPGGTATGAAPGTYEAGIEDYKVLKNSCPATGTVGGTAYAYCGNNWWGYDTPSTIAGKMTYVKNQGLAGAFFWEFSGDTGNGELVSAIKNNL